MTLIESIHISSKPQRYEFSISDFKDVSDYETQLQTVGENVQGYLLKVIGNKPLNNDNLNLRIRTLPEVIKELLINVFDYGIMELDSSFRDCIDSKEKFESKREEYIKNERCYLKSNLDEELRLEDDRLTKLVKVNAKVESFERRLVFEVLHNGKEWSGANDAIKNAFIEANKPPPTIEELMSGVLIDSNNSENSHGRGLLMIANCFHAMNASEDGRTIVCILNY